LQDVREKKTDLLEGNVHLLTRQDLKHKLEKKNARETNIHNHRKSKTPTCTPKCATAEFEGAGMDEGAGAEAAAGAGADMVDLGPSKESRS
jgi:hypothetical protein